MLERLESEAVSFLRPELADVLVGPEVFERLETLGEVVGGDEIGEMVAKLVAGFVVEAFDSRILDRLVHALDLAIGPGMLGPGKAVVDAGSGAGIFEGVSSEELRRGQAAAWLHDTPVLLDALNPRSQRPIMGLLDHFICDGKNRRRNSHV